MNRGQQWPYLPVPSSRTDAILMEPPIRSAAGVLRLLLPKRKNPICERSKNRMPARLGTQPNTASAAQEAKLGHYRFFRNLDR
jgi:hypothetical protein